MYFRREVGKKGQVVIPVDIRKNLNLKPGSNVLFEVRGNEVVLKADIDPVKLVEEFCNFTAEKHPMTPKELKRLIDSQYEEEVDRLLGKRRRHNP